MATNFQTFGEEALDNDSCVRPTPLDALRDTDDSSQGDIARVFHTR